jgi:hypothetical protein
MRVNEDFAGIRGIPATYRFIYCVGCDMRNVDTCRDLAYDVIRFFTIILY